MSHQPIEKREVLAGTHDTTCTLLFVLAYFVAPLLKQEPLLVATAVYVVANAVVFLVSRNFRQGFILVAWVSRLAIVTMGTLTLLLDDGTFIKMNRTIYFGLLSVWSFTSVVAGRPRLQRFASGDRHKDVTQHGWRAATIFAAFVCAVLAIINELVWRNGSTGFWVVFQLWGWVVAELVILPLAMPIFVRNGFSYKRSKTSSAEASK